MKIEHRRIRWGLAKLILVEEFHAWINECKHSRKDTPMDMIEFLYQKGFIKGKKWREYIDSNADKKYYMTMRIMPLEEGKIPPDCMI